MTGTFKLFLQFESDLHAIILTCEGADGLESGIVCIGSELADQIKELVSLEQEFEGAVID